MLNDAGIKEEMRPGIWADCGLMATFFTNILVGSEYEKSHHKLIFSVKFRRLIDSRSFGETVAKQSSAIEARCACLWGTHRIILTISIACFMSKQGMLPSQGIYFVWITFMGVRTQEKVNENGLIILLKMILLRQSTTSWPRNHIFKQSKILPKNIYSEMK
jgi:hypothetical protein